MNHLKLHKQLVVISYQEFCMLYDALMQLSVMLTVVTTLKNSLANASHQGHNLKVHLEEFLWQ